MLPLLSVSMLKCNWLKLETTSKALDSKLSTQGMGKINNKGFSTVLLFQTKQCGYFEFISQENLKKSFCRIPHCLSNTIQNSLDRRIMGHLFPLSVYDIEHS